MLRRLISSGRILALGSGLLSVGVVQTYGNHPAGLINNTSSDKFYARKLEPKRSELNFFVQEGVFWEAAVADAKEKRVSAQAYLQGVEAKCEQFLESDQICDREEFMDALREQFSKKGALALVLGGKSLGKSKIAKKITDEFNAKGKLVLLVDTRLESDTDLTTAIVLAAEKLSLFGSFLGALRKIAPEVSVGPISGLQVPLKSLPVVMELVAKAAHAKNCHPVIVIDEADLALNPKNPTVQSVETTRAMLETFTALSKQAKTHTFILLSSEHAYPFLLRDELQFNLSNVSDQTFVGEVPPADHFKLLTQTWGMGDRLASLCLAAYGGHTYFTSLAVRKLLLQRQAFKAENAASMDIYDNVSFVLDMYPETEGLLWELATTGFAALPNAHDPRAKVLSAANLGGVVNKQAVVVGLPKDAWRTYDHYGIVAPCMMLRLMILQMLLDKAEISGGKDRGK